MLHKNVETDITKTAGENVLYVFSIQTGIATVVVIGWKENFL